LPVQLSDLLIDREEPCLHILEAATGSLPPAASQERSFMPTVKLWTDAEVAANPRIEAVFDDIRATRNSDFVNNFWRALANQPALLERTWGSIKAVMIAPGNLDPLTKELIYIAVSTINGCTYCIHSHTAAARAKGLTDQQHAELLAVIGMAAETNALANALQVPVDPQFLVE
jgi:AhpD family alkylhydroperoxidase